ncbi:LegC family aminotransferase [Amylibacter sp.]|nr:LegC family aminotransferase [Amylibacter sp.]
MIDKNLFELFEKLVRSIYSEDFIPLHRPVFDEHDKKNVANCIDSNFVSSAGKEIASFEQKVSRYTCTKFAISTVTGTAALHVALKVLGVEAQDEVICPCLSFVATANAIKYCGAEPVFLDVEKQNGALCPIQLKKFLIEETKFKNDTLINKNTGRRIRACIVMHTFGHPAQMEELSILCKKFMLPLVEDAAEALGSLSKGKHVGNLCDVAVYSFNGNKIITTGGGGMVTTNDPVLAKKLKHLTTTAKVPHKYEYFHDQLGFNYRMPNLNACLGLNQMDQIEKFLISKRKVANIYSDFFKQTPFRFWSEPDNCESNYWLNTVSFSSSQEKHEFLEFTNSRNIMTRPVWALLSSLPYFKGCYIYGDQVAKSIYETTVNLPSSVPV